MTNEELAAHLEYVDGIQKAQNIVLRALLRQQPTAMTQIQNYIPHLQSQDFYQDLTVEQQRAMMATLELIAGPIQPR